MMAAGCLELVHICTMLPFSHSIFLKLLAAAAECVATSNLNFIFQVGEQLFVLLLRPAQHHIHLILNSERRFSSSIVFARAVV